MIENLINQMTLEEKLGQMTQVNSSGGTLPDDIKESIKNGDVGSISVRIDSKTVNEIQRIAIEESRLGIPIIFGRDVVHGFKTIFPIPLGQAATWNPDLIREGNVSISDIDEAVRRILKMKKKAGLFDDPYVDLEKPSPILDADNLAKARAIATESIVLLKNDNNTLPLNAKRIRKLAVVGPLADQPYDQLGTWIYDGDPEHTITPTKALKDMSNGQFEVIFEPGLTFSRDLNKAGIKKAVGKAKKTDVIVAFVGEESFMSGESHSLADLDLVALQGDLVTALAKTGKPVIMVVLAGRPLTIRKQMEVADAVLYAWHPGTMGGPAIADILFGVESPSGKIPVTFPITVGQIPMYYNHMNTGRPSSKNDHHPIYEIPQHAEQSSPGYKSQYIDEGYLPYLPFGFGLSYSEFNYIELKMSDNKMNVDGELTIDVTFENTGNVDAKEIVQLYVRDLVGSIVRPIKELKGFKKEFLKSGETKQIHFTLKAEDLAFYNGDNKLVIEPGDFKLWVGPNSAEGLEADFVVE